MGRIQSGRASAARPRRRGFAVSRDISELLMAWSINDPPVRIVEGDDGATKLQRRLSLGILQLEMEGRPDGQRPFGHESVYGYLCSKRKDEPESFVLSSDDCHRLASEAILYFQRRLCFFDLGDFDRAARDADRNLAVFAFARQYAGEQEDAWLLDQYRGFVISHRARARAMALMQDRDLDSALAALEEGFQQIRGFLDEYEIDEEMAAGDEIRILKRLKETIAGEKQTVLAVGSRTILEDELRQAIESEQYERAARIRDQLAALETT
jgi:tetratricopeptide (TPR) repeat protein